MVDVDVDGAVGTPADISMERQAFDALPYGLLVLDRHGWVVCSNRAAMQLLGVSGPSETLGLKCCELLGCGLRDSPLDGVCITELILRGGHVLPETHVDVSSPSGRASMWLTAAPIDGTPPRVVVELRSCSPGDQHQRVPASCAAAPKLRISTLGSTVVETPTGPVGGAWLDQRSGQLLKYFVAERRRAVTVDEIGESIWPGANYAVGASVRYYVHALRRVLEPERGARERSAFVVVRNGTYRLDLENVVVDVDEFEARLGTAMTVVRHDPIAGAEGIDQALSLYGGDFLADLPYTEWAMPERHRLHNLACVGLDQLADVRFQSGELDRATGALERLATLQPFDEDVHRRLMEVDIARGRRSDAIRRYAALRCRLRHTFGHDPSFTPADLARSAQV